MSKRSARLTAILIEACILTNDPTTLTLLNRCLLRSRIHDGTLHVDDDLPLPNSKTH